MKRILLFLAVVGLTTLAAFSQKKEIRSVSDFTGIEASSVFDIKVTKGGTESLTIEADDNVMPYVRSEVKQGVLHLYLDTNNGGWELENIKTLKAAVVMKNLDKVSLSGACKLTANDLFTSDEFKGDCSGASKLNVNISTGRLNIGASGASKIQLKANVTNDTKLGVSGASNVNGELKTAGFKFSSSDISTVELTGSATDVNVDVSGTSKIKAENFVVNNAVVEASGTSNITLNVASKLTINSSGACTVNYKGSPSVITNSSGPSKIRKI